MVLACVGLAIHFVRIMRARSDSVYVLQLAIGAGLLALLLHESVDFDLQMPGIAITAVLLLGMALRGGWGRLEPGRGGSERHLSNATLSLSTLLAVVFLGLVFAQPTASGNREAPRGMMAALRSIEEFPVDSPAHLNLSLRFADLSPELALESLNAAVALNPNSPGPRDARAVLSARLGNEALALSDIEESMYRAPSRSQHPLLGSAAVSWLPAESRAAAERISSGRRRCRLSSGGGAGWILFGRRRSRICCASVGAGSRPCSARDASSRPAPAGWLGVVAGRRSGWSRDFVACFNSPSPDRGSPSRIIDRSSHGWSRRFGGCQTRA